jgi:TonB family protein
VTIIQSTYNTGYQSASPVPGYPEFREYIKTNLQFPPNDTIHSKAIVVLSFIVGENGRPEDISVVKSPGKKFSNEAIRLLKNGPDWFPPKRDGLKIKEETVIRIIFKPDY